ncbi:hypothetical protein LEM8419_00552 [Neolewinella maritima]|uniref:Glycosyltransferase 2-like domain-containing protein n=1 Tax=Neolewinella maritima TaxID=1383882 RepID=A0ABN8F563_9BACT|nr:glycosyltransferase [Neolewinella maritima]CAH0999255.1 hypothetical protein LEM8419_00552 [Neolewinella maritima]
MLSICVPVYNYDARPLVHELLRQADEMSEAVEVLVYEDGSAPEQQCINQSLADLPNVRYVALPENTGRASIRNRMAKDAQYAILVMLDVDGEPNPYLLRNYISRPTEATVVVGGRSYTSEPPDDPALRLHWQYGRYREALAPARFRPRPYLHFQSNNFRVDRQFFLDNPFPEVHSYGHEDTLWGQLLAPAGTRIEYIDNPVLHLGLEPEEVFIAKQRQAVQTLKSLRKAHPTLTTRLTTFADRYPRMSQLAELLPEEMLVRYLMRTRNLKVLDMLKLKWWITGWALAIGYS